MSIYISGLEFPKVPTFIILLPDGKVEIPSQARMAKAMPVQEHGDLKDLDAMGVLSWNTEDEGDFEDGVLFVLDKLEELPVVIPGDQEKEETE